MEGNAMTSSVIGAVMMALKTCGLRLGPDESHVLTAPSPPSVIGAPMLPEEDGSDREDLFDTCAQPKPWTPSGAECNDDM